MHRLRTVVPQSVLLSLSSRQTPKIFLLFTRTFYKTKKRLTLKRYWVDQEGLYFRTQMYANVRNSAI